MMSTEELIQAQAELDHSSIQQTVEAVSISHEHGFASLGHFASMLLHGDSSDGSNNDTTSVGGGAASMSAKSMAEEVKALHELPMLLPRESIQESLLRVTLLTCLITLFHLFLYKSIRRLLSPNKQQQQQQSLFHSTSATEQRSQERLTEVSRKISYQLLHFCVNLFLGLSGIIAYLHIRQHRSLQPYSMTQIVSGLVQYKIFGECQVAYQLWSIPAGIFFVKEPLSMLGHHVAVFCVTCNAAFSTCGYRYYAPFFFAAVESSSVFLSIVNTLKSHDSLKASFPTLDNMAKLLFAAFFLVFRVFLWLPEIAGFFPVGIRMYATCPTHMCRGVYVGILSSAAFLTSLQLLWGYKIVIILMKMAVGGGGDQEHEGKKGERSNGGEGHHVKGD